MKRAAVIEAELSLLHGLLALPPRSVLTGVRLPAGTGLVEFEVEHPDLPQVAAGDAPPVVRPEELRLLAGRGAR